MIFRGAFKLLLASAFVVIPMSSVAQAPSPATSAFREASRDVAERIRLAVDAIPAERFVAKANPRSRRLVELLLAVASRTYYLCGRVADARPPSKGAPSTEAGKDSLRRWISDAFEFCDRSMMSVTDAGLADSVAMSLQDFVMGPPPRVPRALAMNYATAYWADAYAQLASYFRADGKAPPEMCRGAGKVMWNLNQLCDSGPNVCFDSSGGRRVSRLTIADSGYSVTSDGRGPYRPGSGNVVAVFAARPVGMVLGGAPGDSGRSIRIDLNRPVPRDVGKPLGIIVANHDLEFSAQWYRDPDFRTHTVVEIPIGSTVEARQIEVGFHLDGAYHVLQVGSQGYGHCAADGTAIYGDGTTPGTIFRETETRWVVTLPPGSIGRLFDNRFGDPNAVNRGLYYVSLRFVVEN